MGTRRIAALLTLPLAMACRGPAPSIPPSAVEPVARTTTVWLGAGALDDMTAAELRLAGVDRLLVRRGVLDLSGGTPVLGFEPKPSIAGDIPVGMVLRLEGAGEQIDADTARAVWRAIAAQEGGDQPAEIVLDMAEVPVAMDTLVAELRKVSGVPVVPLLSVNQLANEPALRVAAAAGTCIVPVAGTVHPGLRGVGEASTVPLIKKLAPLVDARIAVRPAINLAPVTLPDIDRWGDDLDPLTEPPGTEIRTSSELDRTFVLGGPVDWSGRSWPAASRVAVGWWDTAKLHATLADIDRLMLPEVVGWDLVPLPPPGVRLGLGQEVLLRYLAGDGPAPTLAVDVQRSGRTVRVTITNTGPFVSAVSSVGNWLEVSVPQGSLLVNGVGEFDGFELGTRRTGEWQARGAPVADAVRFSEIYVAPFEEIETGSMRISVARSQVRVRWHVLLSSGEEVTGELTR